MSLSPTISIPKVSTNGLSSQEVNSSSQGCSEKASLYSLNVRLVGVGFRAAVLKIRLKELQGPFATDIFKSRYLRDDSAPTIGAYGKGDSVSKVPTAGTYSTPYMKVLSLKVGKSASTLYPIPAKVDIYCPTDQQQQAENQPFLVTSSNWHELTRVVSEIQSYKDLDPYKGSGIHICDRIETDTGEIFPIRSKNSRPLKEIKK